MCNSRTKPEDLKDICLNSDIIVCAAGKTDTVGASHVNGAQTIIDVGINFDDEGKMCGDVNFEAIDGKAAALTPVPGGVGSVTTALLLQHVVEAACKG